MLARLLSCKEPLLLSAGAIWGANTLGFAITAATHTHKLTDLTGTGNQQTESDCTSKKCEQASQAIPRGGACLRASASN